MAINPVKYVKNPCPAALFCGCRPVVDYRCVCRSDMDVDLRSTTDMSVDAFDGCRPMVDYLIVYNPESNGDLRSPTSCLLSVLPPFTSSLSQPYGCTQRNTPLQQSKQATKKKKKKRPYANVRVVSYLSANQTGAELAKPCFKRHPTHAVPATWGTQEVRRAIEGQTNRARGSTSQSCAVLARAGAGTGAVCTAAALAAVAADDGMTTR